MNSLTSPTLPSHFKIAAFTSLFFVLTVSVFVFYHGKKESFILINGFNSGPMDYFFQYITLLGDGLIYIPILIYCILYNRQFLVPVIAGIIICTVLTHFLKRVVFPNELRPLSLEAEKIILHKVEGVPVHRMHSFPSGHTSTAFSMALLLATVMRRRIWAYLLPLIAFLVGYSRIYLAQHFPIDVCAGILIGIVSAYLSMLIYNRYQKRRKEKGLSASTPSMG